MTERTHVSSETVERRREKTVRTLDCPVCGVGAGSPCRTERIAGYTEPLVHAHTGRYENAVVQGLVPPLGGRHGA